MAKSSSNIPLPSSARHNNRRDVSDRSKTPCKGVSRATATPNVSKAQSNVDSFMSRTPETAYLADTLTRSGVATIFGRKIDSPQFQTLAAPVTPIASKSKRSSMYNGAQIAEPCVADALAHILEPCGHRVMTEAPEACGSNCRGCDSFFANARTGAPFACGVCIAGSVRGHYSAKRVLFRQNLERLESSLGGSFQPEGKEQRVACMEAVWRSNMKEEQQALQKLGRRCEAINCELCDDSGSLMTESATPSTPHSCWAGAVEGKDHQSPSSPLVAKAQRKAKGMSRLPVPSRR